VNRPEHSRFAARKAEASAKDNTNRNFFIRRGGVTVIYTNPRPKFHLKVVSSFNQISGGLVILKL
jgi:hypothetical protein